MERTTLAPRSACVLANLLLALGGCDDAGLPLPIDGGRPDRAVDATTADLGGVDAATQDLRIPVDMRATIVDATVDHAPPIFNGALFARLPAGRFSMGSPVGEPDRNVDETQHDVTITRSFLVQTTEVTQAQWRALMGNNPSSFKGDSLPVEMVSWFDAVAYCNALSRQYKLPEAYTLTNVKGTPGAANFVATVAWAGPSTTGFRLPTEAEWEYACRAGTPHGRYGAIDSVAWYMDNSTSKTHPVGTKTANTWGLLDMLGNVWEWTWDGYGDYGSKPVVDPTGAAGAGSVRVYRGGSWASGAWMVRASQRYFDPGYRNVIGFRPARTVP